MQQSSQRSFKELYDSTIQQIQNDSSLLIHYAKKNCRKCQGKGYIEIKNVGQQDFHKMVCWCVVKNIKKEIEEILA